ncbi:MAG: sulfite exporter TauE/SafE family protein, partial [Candidatus Latescibacterota bacterium]|nr:sulfite exporter TauE/SafE family protein [Candidatus Latescibacterota bacterium]
MDALFLVLASFFTSALTAVIGVGGGMLLISLMPGAIPIAAIVPVHGAVQLVSNASRVLWGVRHIEWSIFWPFLGGAGIGAWVGAPLVHHVPTQYMPLLLGLFILIFTWLPKREKSFRLPGHFALMGATQTFIALFVGVSGP